MIRNPAFAGQFYPGKASTLRDQVRQLTHIVPDPLDAIAMVVPHAGYVYSGRVAGAVYGQVELREKVIILGPNHTGQGEMFSLMAKGIWVTLLGDLQVDQQLAKELLDNSSFFKSDDEAHLHEHSIEVQLPFIANLNPKVKIVPITIGLAKLEDYLAIGQEIARVIEPIKDKVTIIASTDMTHYEPEEKAKEQDNLAIDAILALDPELLTRYVWEHDISMCGHGAVAIMLEAVRNLGAERAELVRYQTSGDASGDHSSVVGYAGIVIT